MTEEKARVKELAAELGVSGKDMLGTLRELNIPAKSLVATLSAEDVAKVKARLKNPVGSTERRTTESGVIVRRRRDVEAPAVATPTPQQESAPATEETKSAAGKTLPPRTKDTSAKTDSAPKAKAKQPEKPLEKPARVIRRPQETTKPVVEQDAAPPHPPAPDAPADPSAAAIPQKTARIQESTTSAAPEKPQVKIIRPAAPNLSAEPDRGANGQAVSSAPGLAPRSERGDEHAFYTDSSETRTSRKGHEEDAGSQVRVISRPDQFPRGQRSPRQPGSSDPPRTPRPSGPGGRGPRPGPGRPFAPSGTKSGFGGGMPPAMPGETPADRSKKKGQKGRRTVVDFNTGGADDFSKRRSKEIDIDDGAWATRSRRKPRKNRDQQQQRSVVTQPIKAAKRKIRVDEFIRVADLAHQMGLKSGEIIKVLFNLGMMATINNMLDVDTTTLVAAEFEYEVEKVGFSEEALLEQSAPDNPESLKPRPPVVTIMGHVDHGKTSLLDAIRKASVASGEAGGITQHIGAYQVGTPKGEIVFLDTPGHEAFTAMRARGAKITDIVVLVVAADDGVMEQTREAVSHAKAADVPIMVAVNKIDKPEANPDRIKRELAELGLVPEEWGGQTTYSNVSAKMRLGLDELMELLALQAEILELKANPDKPARGHIIEAKLDKGRGAVGTVLIQQGTLKLGDSFVCGAHFGRVRAMFDDQGHKVKQATPSTPVEVQGFEGVPEAGEAFIAMFDEKAARRIADTRAIKLREKVIAKESRVTLETFLSRKPDAVEALILNLVVKADVQGSLEAITDALLKLSTGKVRLNVIHGGVGAISESDVLLASASDAIIIGFNVRPSQKAKELIGHEKVDTRFYDIIYKLVEEMKSAMTGMLAPVSKEVYLGNAEVREVFSVPKIGAIAGCHVSDGKVTRNALVRLLRDNVVIYTGKVSSLRRFKDDVREVLKGYECGIGLDRYNDIKIGDSIEAFEIIEEAATLS